MTDKVAIDNLEKYIDLVLNKNYCDCNELNVISNGGYCDGSKNVAVAIKHLIKRYKELEQIEEAHHKLNGELRKDVEMLEKSLGVHDEIIARLEERLTENDKIVLDIIKRLDNDIKNITETKADGYTDDYRRCRLKAYRTKTREIKEYIEEKYFGKKVSEE